MSIVLWPRQEILQLVTPQLANSGRSLTQKLVEEVVIKLAELQSSEGKISFENWKNIALEQIRWNDAAISLFWELLSLAVYYLNPEKIASTKREENLIELECLAVFLILHIPEPSNLLKQSTVSSTFDSVWPLNADGEVYPTSPVSSPLSPTKESNNSNNRTGFKSPIGSPLSPRSPRNTTHQQTSTPSPKRSVASTAKTPRSSTQHLHSVRWKIPLMLSALNPDLKEGHSYDTNDDFTANIETFPVSRRIFDALGMMLSGGHSREKPITPLSSLHPNWSGEHDTPRQTQDFSGSNSLLEGTNVHGPLLSADVLSWINLHLSMNDVIYPVSLHASGGVNPVTSSPSTTAVGPLDLEGTGVKDGKGHPQRVISSVATLSRFSPTVVNSNSTTLIHVVTLGPSRSSSFRRMNRSYSDMSTTSNVGGGGGMTAFNTMDSDLLRQSFGTRQPLMIPPHVHSNDYDSEMESSSVHEFGLSSDMNELTESTPRMINNASVGSPLSPHGFGKGHFSPQSREHKEAKFDLSSELNHVADGSPHPLLPHSNSSNHSTSPIRQHSVEELDPSSHSNTPAPLGNFLPKTISARDRDLNAAFDLSFAGGATTWKPELSLPQLFLNYSQSSKLYFISPYYSATITGCIKCDIVIGAVFGAVIISGCENCRISVTCRKLIVINCVDCDIFLASLSPSIISGDCRNVAIGPINVTYRNYRHHLKLTELKALIKSNTTSSLNVPAATASSSSTSHKEPASSFDPSSLETTAANQWFQYLDVNTCTNESNNNSNSLRSPTLSPTKASHKKFFPDSNNHSTSSSSSSSHAVKLMSPDRFYTVTIPIKSEFISFEFSPIAIPVEFSEAIKYRQDTVETIKHQIQDYLESEHQQHHHLPTSHRKANSRSQLGDESVVEEREEEEEEVDGSLKDAEASLTAKLLTSSAISKRFMEWLVASDHVQEVLDLIRIDSDKNANIHQ